MSSPKISLLVLLAFASSDAAQPVQFNKDIRPILADACFHCHGPDPGTRKAGLRLDTEAGFFTAKKGERPTVIKGQPDLSSLYQRLLSTDEDEVMPPPDSHKEIKPAQIALIKEWISQGAPWQPHWSLIPPQKPTVPAVKDESWVKTPIDRFVLASLDQAGLKPAPEADAHTLVRRISLDLTGLPPSAELLARYTRDRANLIDQEVSALIDELMKSPAYGEHRARYWLDAARYGDTHGLHFDNYREMWPYRDWVVKAFNRNQPFDQFTVEQIAGDLLPNHTDDQLIATGFQRCNITTNEGGTIDEENLANYAVDRVQTMGWVYMGLTTNCSQCHDHKFDPITQRDFYSLAAFFRNTTQGAKDGNVKDGKGPVLVIPSETDKPRWEKLPTEIATATKQRDERRKLAGGDFNAWLASAKPEHLDQDVPTKGLQVHLPLNEGVGNDVANVCGTPAKAKALGQISWTPGGKLGPAPVIKPGSTFEVSDAGDFELNQKFSYGAWIKAGRNGVFGAIMARMDEKNGYRGWDLWQNNRGLSVHLVDKWEENALKVSTRDAVLKPGEWQHVFVTYNGNGKPGGIQIYINGVPQKRLNGEKNTLKPKASIRTTVPLKIGQRSEGQHFTEGSVQDARVYDRMLSETEIKTLADVGPLRAVLAAASDKRTPQQRNALFAHYLATRDTDWMKHDSTAKKLEAEKDAIKGRSPITHVQEEVMNVAPMANILARGAYDKVGERVEAAVPAALGKLPEKAPKNRLGLAQWVVSAENPLTSRVTVNRFWQEVFGQGIVKTPEDFGIMGAAPSHPELLDWLAVEFREGGWDVKKLFKLLLSSATYRQSAATTPEKLDKDRDNSLLSRGPRFRMDAEMLRDYALAASGLLSAKMGGPSVKPYQPEGIWDVVGLPGGDTRNYVQDKGENLYRRTFYTFWKRMAPPPSMEVFNAPSREVCAVRRERTNTPLQALVTMNDPQFVEAARKLAEKALATKEPLSFIAERILCRPLTDKEKPLVEASLKDLRAHYSKNAADAEALLKVGESPVDAKLPKPELAAWTMLTNQIFNLDEVLNK
jgi:mono/diheme cytochrome c family protein